ncbi:hypothetical protein KFS98_003731 [Salmonella enterica]|nr:hypothetical protein [Salmonella enterica]
MIQGSIELFNLKQQLEVTQARIRSLSDAHRAEVQSILHAGQEALKYNPDAVLYAIVFHEAYSYSVQIKANAKFTNNRLRVFWSFDETFGFVNLDNVMTFVNPATYARFLALEHLRYYVPKMRDFADQQLPYLGVTTDNEPKWTLQQVLDVLYQNQKTVVFGKPLLEILKTLNIR